MGRLKAVNRAGKVNGPLEKTIIASKEELSGYRSKFNTVGDMLRVGTPIIHIADVTGLTFAAVQQYAFAHKQYN